MGEAYCDDNFKILMRLIEAGADINTVGLMWKCVSPSSSLGPPSVT